MFNKNGFATRAIHIGQQGDNEYDTVVPPIYLTSTYKQDYPGQFKAYDYTRAGNPNFANLEATLSSLENGRFSTVFNSGLGAATSVLSRLRPGNRIIAIDDIYGGTFRLMDKVLKNFQIESTFGDVNNPDWLKTQLQKGAQIVWVETPTNPLLQLADIKAIAKICSQYKVTFLLDNTFATPYFQTPLDLGADLVLHSTTKYISGHSDLIGGCVVTNSKEWKDHLDFTRMAMGFNPSPFDTWLMSRSVKTLALRMEKHQANAMELAQRLIKHPLVKKVIYPGLPSHPQFELAQKQMRGFSGIVSVTLDADLEKTKKIISSFDLFTLAESLGAVESLVNHPASMTHASIPKETRLSRGLEDGLIRFSVGLEDVEDLWQDLEMYLV